MPKKTRLPTKKEERDFVNNLKPSEKQYTVFPILSADELYGEPVDWNGIIYIKPKVTFWQKIKKLLRFNKKCKHTKITSKRMRTRV